MFTLTFTEPSGRRDSVPLVDEEAGLVAGRDPSCDVVLQSKEVSRRHARFYVRDGVVVVEDLGSHNGVWIDGQRIEGPAPLAGAVEVGDVRVAASGSAGAGRAPSPRSTAPTPVSGSPAAGPPPPGSARAGAAAARQRAIEKARETAAPVGKPRPAAEASPAAGAGRPVRQAPLPPAPPGMQGVGAGAALRGLGNASKVQVRLPPKAVVGRGQDCDVVLDDDSVSRHHAELFRDDRGLYRVRDLGSANGTFVDGQRPQDGELLPDGARLRFGDVELLFWKPPAGASPAARQRQLLVVAVVMIAGFAGLYALRERKAQREAAAARLDETPEDEARTLSEQAQGALESERFDEAARLAQAAIDKDPVAAPPRKTLAQARREQAAQRLFAEASAKAAVGNEDEALRLFAQVDPQSRFFARARIKAKDLAQGSLRTHAKACAADVSRERWEPAADECGLALDLKCQLGPVDADPLYKALRRAEKAAGRRVPWHCPAQLAPLFHDTTPQADAAAADGQRALAARFPDEKVRDAVLQYARGEVGQALRALAAPSVARGKNAALAAQAAEQMRVVDGRFREGQTALLRGELTRAHETWREALRADAALVPPGMESFYGGQIRSTLAEAHLKAGDERLAKGQVQSAFDAYSRGLEARPADPRLADGLARLEKSAEAILGSSPTCEQVQTALHITRAEPPSPAHVAAQKAAAACQ